MVLLDALDVSCAQLTRDLFAIAIVFVVNQYGHRTYGMNVTHKTTDTQQACGRKKT